MQIKCDECEESPAVYSVGLSDTKFVCEPCLTWGDHKRWWNLEPRQRISPAKLRVDPYTFEVFHE